MKRDWKLLLLVARVWQPVTDYWSRTTDWPLVGRLAGYVLNDKHYDVTFIPINQEIDDAGTTVLPKQVVYDIVERAANRVILPICLCRVGCRCEDYPMEIGCIFLGEASRQIHPSIGKSVSVEEAKAHLDRGMAAGLIPQVGRVDPDPLMLGIKDRYHFLTLCLCCTCCCIAMRNMPRWSPRVKERMHALEGLNIEVTDECNGCQKCVKACFADAIVMENERAIITEDCKGCGICASTCPQDAIDITVSDADRMLREAFRRIESYSDIT